MFKQLFTEDFDTDLNMEIFKFLKKKYKKSFTRLEDDFKEDEIVEFEYKKRKFKIYINLKSYNKPVYDYEWL